MVDPQRATVTVGPGRLRTHRLIQGSLIVLAVCVYLVFLTDVIVTELLNASEYYNYTRYYNQSEAEEYCENPSSCVFKCCPVEQGLYSSQNLSCGPNQANTLLNNTQFITLFTSLDKSNFSHFTNEHSFIFEDCAEYDTQLGPMYDLNRNISLIINSSDLFPNVFCVDVIMGTNQTVIKICDTKAENGSSDFPEYLFMFCSTISTLAMLATLTVYIYLPQLRNLQGKILICYLVSITIFNTSFISMQLSGSRGYLVLSYITDSFLLGWLSWLTVMGYDIWHTFSRPLQPHPQPQGPRRFLVYSLAGWGCPALHLVIVETTTVRFDQFLLPCVHLTVVLNLTMFLSTLANLRLHHSPQLRSRRHGASHSGILVYAKLGLLMGLDWCLMTVCAFTGVTVLKIVALAFLASQGVFLLMFLVCNRRVCRLLRAKWTAHSESSPTHPSSLTHKR